MTFFAAVVVTVLFDAPKVSFVPEVVFAAAPPMLVIWAIAALMAAE